jgi:STE24 endopeptidase
MKDLARRGGISISDVEVMDASKRTKHNNAFFAGLGKTRKLVIYDNMLEFDRELIDVVVSHEIGHWRHGHLRRAIALGTITTFVEFYVLDLLLGTKAIMDWAGVDSIGNPAAIPLFLGGFGLIATLVGLIDSWVSRVHERQADLFALELTEDPDSYIKVWREFTEKDLAELTPSWWKKINGSHPPIADRIAFAKVWQDSPNGRKPSQPLS